MINSPDRISLLLSTTLVSVLFGNCSAQASKGQEIFYGSMRTASDERLQISACPSTSIQALASTAGITLSSPSTKLLVSLDEMESTEIVAGDFWHNGRCFIAVKSSTGLVNDSFEIHRMDSSRSRGPDWTAINPEFSRGHIISSYRDAGRWHEETLCYSETIDAPFVCSRRENATDQIQRLTTCDDRAECGETSMVLSGTDRAADAAVSVGRAFFFENNGGLFERRRSYLVKGDRIVLLDYFDEGAELYFKASYTGDSGTTAGWLSSHDLYISDPE